MKPHRPLLLSLALAAWTAGCASNRAMVSTWCDPHFSPNRADKIALASRPLPAPGDADLQRALMAGLKRGGFHLVPQTRADYTLAFAVEDDWTPIIVPASRIAPQPAPPSLVVGVSSPGTTVPIGPPEGPQTYSATPPTFLETPPPPGESSTKAIRLYLYANPKTHRGRLETAWEGCIDAGHTLSADREPALLKTLLGYFGRSYTGRVPVSR